jgi:predicted nucleic acid-binding protein
MDNLDFNYRQSVFLDETALTAYMNSENPHYTKAQSLFVELDDLDRQLITTNYIIFDTHQWLRNNAGYKQAETFINSMNKAAALGKLEMIPGDPQLELDAKQLLLERNEYQFSLNEAVTTVIIMTHQIKKIFTFNPKFSLIRKLDSSIKVIPSVL